MCIPPRIADHPAAALADEAVLARSQCRRVAHDCCRAMIEPLPPKRITTISCLCTDPMNMLLDMRHWKAAVQSQVLTATEASQLRTHRLQLWWSLSKAGVPQISCEGIQLHLDWRLLLAMPGAGRMTKRIRWSPGGRLPGMLRVHGSRLVRMLVQRQMLRLRLLQILRLWRGRLLCCVSCAGCRR